MQNEDYDDSDELKCRSFSKLLDTYLTVGKMDETEYHQLTYKQKEVIQCFKRCFKRINKQQ